MNGFVFAPKYNHHGNDATGAFHPGAAIYSDLFGLSTPYLFDNHNTNSKKLREEIYHKIQSAGGPLDCLVYFGHGYPDQLVSADIYANDVPDFAKCISGNANQGIQILLYACLSGAQPADLRGHLPKYYKINKKTHCIEHHNKCFTECFAAALSKELAHKDATVYGHTTSAHTFKNPNLRQYKNGVGSWVVDPSAGKKWGQWKRLIHDLPDESSTHNSNSILWAKFPWMSDDQFNRALEMEEDLLGRWEVTIEGSDSSHYVFLNNGRVVKTDPKHQTKLLCDPGYWDYSATSVVVEWTETSNEVWEQPLNKTRQKGRGPDYTFLAKKIRFPKHDPKERFGVKWQPNRLGKMQPHYKRCEVKDWF